jgi:aryl-alcohol dehydrogenase-like predicted oxidoreductase
VALRVLEAGWLTDWPPSASAAAAQPCEASTARLASLAALLAPDSLTHGAVRFALSRPEVATVLVGFSNAAQVEDAVASAAKGPLPRALLSRIDAWRAGVAAGSASVPHGP